MLFPSLDVCFYWLAQISEIDNRLVTAYTVKTATGVQCQCFTLKKDRLRSCLFVSHRRLFCVSNNQSGYLTFRTTIVKDTKLLLDIYLPDST